MTSQPTRPIRLGPVLAALGLLAVAGCGGSGEQPDVPPPAPAGASPTLSEEERQAQEYGDEAVASLQALLEEQDRLYGEGPGARVTDEVEQHATDPYLQQLEHALEWLSVENIRDESPVTRFLIEPVGEATAEQVDVAVCVDTSTRRTVKAENGEPYDDGSEPMKKLMVYEMHQLDGEWKAKDQDETVLEAWNQAPCDGSWES